MDNEIVHVMLKPDTLEFGMREVILNELLGVGGTLLLSKRLVLSMRQISDIYPYFDNERAKDVVFRYFTTRETEHLAFVGPVGIHARYQQAKGKTGTGMGIKGRHYTRYTMLTKSELAHWFEGTLENIGNIDLEMFARDILHIPNSPEESVNGLLSILDPDEVVLLSKYLCPR